MKYYSFKYFLHCCNFGLSGTVYHLYHFHSIHFASSTVFLYTDYVYLKHSFEPFRFCTTPLYEPAASEDPLKTVLSFSLFLPLSRILVQWQLAVYIYPGNLKILWKLYFEQFYLGRLHAIPGEKFANCVYCSSAS